MPPANETAAHFAAAACNGPDRKPARPSIAWRRPERLTASRTHDTTSSLPTMIGLLSCLCQAPAMPTPRCPSARTLCPASVPCCACDVAGNRVCFILPMDVPTTESDPIDSNPLPHPPGWLSRCFCLAHIGGRGEASYARDHMDVSAADERDGDWRKPLVPPLLRAGAVRRDDRGAGPGIELARASVVPLRQCGEDALGRPPRRRRRRHGRSHGPAPTAPGPFHRTVAGRRDGPGHLGGVAGRGERKAALEADRRSVRSRCDHEHGRPRRPIRHHRRDGGRQAVQVFVRVDRAPRPEGRAALAPLVLPRPELGLRRAGSLPGGRPHSRADSTRGSRSFHGLGQQSLSRPVGPAASRLAGP